MESIKNTCIQALIFIRIIITGVRKWRWIGVMVNHTDHMHWQWCTQWSKKGKATINQCGNAKLSITSMNDLTYCVSQPPPLPPSIDILLIYVCSWLIFIKFRRISGQKHARKLSLDILFKYFQYCQCHTPSDIYMWTLIILIST